MTACAHLDRAVTVPDARTLDGGEGGPPAVRSVEPGETWRRCCQDEVVA